MAGIKGKGGKKGRSGPPGNLNARSHAWGAFWRRRALKATDRWILPVIENYASGLASDKPLLTQAEARMIEIAQIARGASMLVLAECARSGFTRKVDGGTWDLSPGAKELAKFLSVERGALLGLGLERRAKPALSLTDYLNGKPPAPAPAPDTTPTHDEADVADPQATTTPPHTTDGATPAPPETQSKIHSPTHKEI
jgi:hypothetical protein